METIRIRTFPAEQETIPALLEEKGIRVNAYALQYFSHPRFAANVPEEMELVILSLKELGLCGEITLPDIYSRTEKLGYLLCPPCTGLYLRLAWTDQPQSNDSVLTGSRRAPDGSITVLSAVLEEDDDYPKGLYLRNVDGTLWLRGYICDNSHIWSENDRIALLRRMEKTEW